jgi:hypothetical protein
LERIASEMARPAASSAARLILKPDESFSRDLFREFLFSVRCLFAVVAGRLCCNTMVNLLAEYPQLNFHFPATGAADEFQSSLQEYRQETIFLLHLMQSNYSR